MKPQETVDFHIRWSWYNISRMYNTKANEFGGGTFAQKGFFTINEITKKDNGSVSFQARSNVDGKWYDFGYSSIIAIDGMEPEKLANAYGIKLSKVNSNTKKK